MSQVSVSVERADKSGRKVLQTLSMAHRERFGQFFTPTNLARFMADRFPERFLAELRRQEKVRVLDPGAGSGILGLAFLDALHAKPMRGRVEITAVEIDGALIGTLQENLGATKAECRARGYTVDVNVVHVDYLQAPGLLNFDAAILNPPYGKMRANDARLETRRDLVHGQPNIYAIFLAEAMRHLRQGGRMMAICPRSVASGPYFAKVRGNLLAAGGLESVAMFKARDKLFSRDEVLQETVVLSMEKGCSQGPVLVEVFHPERLEMEKATYVDELHPRYFEGAKPWPLPHTAKEFEAFERLEAFGNRLGDTGAVVKTGPVIPFRTSGLRAKPSASTVPMVWMSNVQRSGLQWPQAGKRQQYYEPCGEDDVLVVPNEWMVLVRRISSRDDENRFIAAIWNPYQIAGGGVAVENRVNIIRGIDEATARRILDHIHSDAAEGWLRVRSGTTQVNADDLRAMPLGC